MPDMETAFEFRRAMHKHRNIPMLKKAPRKILLMLRDSDRRKLHNIDALTKIIDSYNMSYRFDRV